MHGYPVMQVVQYSVPPCSWPPVDSHRSSQPPSVSPRTGIRKYVVWCLICGGLSCLLGIMFLGVYFLVRSYTSTIGYFETVPTFVPATLLMLTGLCIISLARRRNRYSYLIKLSGACGLSSALTCALVTVTTTVIHMSRLQALRECEYTRKTRTCTCYSVETHTMQDESGNLGGNDEIGYRFVFDSADECTVVHNALYSCLRAIFGISVAGVLVAVFSCMLVYQLLSHERKKMIWEQLELRRRQAYGRQSPPSWPSLANGPSIIGTPRNGPCRCCEQCHSHRNLMQPSYSWDNDNRFWSPPASGYYAQGSEDHMIVSRMVNQNSMQTQRPGWSWPRFPWQRSENQRFRQTPSSPDSQYGFSTNMSRLDNTNMMQSYTLINNPHHFGIWGPPPPYSDPNSPVRRSNRYLYNQCQQITEHSGVVIQPISSQPHQSTMSTMDCTQPIVSESHHAIEQICSTPTHQTHRTKNRMNAFKAKDAAESTTLSDSDTQHATHSNTLPFRKPRKRIDNGVKTVTSNQPASRVNIQNIFGSAQNMSISGRIDNSRTYDNVAGCSSNSVRTKARPNTGVDNSGYQSMEEILITSPATGSFPSNSDQPNGNRDVFTRSRMHFPPREYEKLTNLNANIKHITSTSPRNANNNSSHSLPKDLTRYSICSAESEKTDYTDVSPMTPSTPFAAEDPNAITLVFQRELKQQQQQKQPQQKQPQQKHQHHVHRYKDHSEASGSGCTYNGRYYDGIEPKRDTQRTKNMPEVHLRASIQNASAAANHLLTVDNGASLDNLNSSSNLYQKFERRSVYQRPTYSFASAHSTPGHSHSGNSASMKHAVTNTPKKRNVYVTHSLGSPSNLSSDIDLVRLTNIRKEPKSDDTNKDDRKPYDTHNKQMNENEWPDHSGDRRL